LDKHTKEGCGKELLSHWKLFEGSWREEFFRWESKKCVKKALKTENFLLKCPVVGEMVGFLPWTLREM